MHATLFSSWCRDAKISFWNPTAQTQSFDTQIFTRSTGADNQRSAHRCPISKALKEQCKPVVFFFSSPQPQSPGLTECRKPVLPAASLKLIIKVSQMFILLSHEEAQQRQIKATHLTVHAGIAPPLSVLWTVVPKQAHHQLPCGESNHYLVGLLISLVQQCH